MVDLAGSEKIKKFTDMSNTHLKVSTTTTTASVGMVVDVTFMLLRSREVIVVALILALKR